MIHLVDRLTEIVNNILLYCGSNSDTISQMEIRLLHILGYNQELTMMAG